MQEKTKILFRACIATTAFLTSGVFLKADEKRPNILVILTDDQRFDAMGFMDHPFLKTPHIDRIANEGAHLKNAFVTTSLCSPSRASILTGLYAHNHRVVDNYNPIPEGLRYFPEYLKEAGYETAFIGKWHSGVVTWSLWDIKDVRHDAREDVVKIGLWGRNLRPQKAYDELQQMLENPPPVK